LVGAWKVHFECGWGSGDEIITVSQSGDGRLTFSGGTWNNPITGGEYENGSIKIYAGNFMNSLIYVGHQMSANSMAGTYTQTLNGTPCTFVGRK
jgi:hypothetical protein